MHASPPPCSVSCVIPPARQEPPTDCWSHPQPLPTRTVSKMGGAETVRRWQGRSPFIGACGLFRWGPQSTAANQPSLLAWKGHGTRGQCLHSFRDCRISFSLAHVSHALASFLILTLSGKGSERSPKLLRSVMLPDSDVKSCLGHRRAPQV